MCQCHGLPHAVRSPRFAYLTPRTLPPAEKLGGPRRRARHRLRERGGRARRSRRRRCRSSRARQRGSRPGSTTTTTTATSTTPAIPRFVLSTKAEHGACPEMVTPEVVRDAGPGRHGRRAPRSRRALLGRQVGARRRRALRGRRRRRARRRHAPRRRRGRSRPASTARCGRAFATRRSSTGSSSTWWRARRRPLLWEEIELAAREIDPLLDESAPPRRALRACATASPSSRPRGRAVRQDRAPAAGAGERAGGDRARLGLAHHRGRLRVGVRLRALFHLGGGMPTRVTVPEARLNEVMTKLAAETARRTAETCRRGSLGVSARDMATRRCARAHRPDPSADGARLRSRRACCRPRAACERAWRPRGRCPRAATSRAGRGAARGAVPRVASHGHRRWRPARPRGGDHRLARGAPRARRSTSGLHRLCPKTGARPPSARRRARAITARLLEALPDDPRAARQGRARGLRLRPGGHRHRRDRRLLSRASTRSPSTASRTACSRVGGAGACRA